MTLHARLAVSRPDFSLDVSLEISSGSTIAIVGPNGAGKTTVLRLLAGLAVDGVTAAEIRLDESDLQDVPADRRNLGVVFQDLRLFPHLDARDNVAYPLRARGIRRDEARAEASAELARLGIDGAVAGRRPARLSGGEAQRVATARALVGDPGLLLLDEPFSAVDAGARVWARSLLAERLSSFGGITIVITHDAADALLLGDEVVVLEGGRVVQHGTGGEVARRPATRFAAELVGTNLVPARQQRGGQQGDGRWTTPAGTEVTVAPPASPGSGIVDGPESGERATGVGALIIPPAAVALHRDQPAGSARNVWPVQVRGVEVVGGRARIVLALPAGDELVAEVTLGAVDDLAIATGAELWASLKATEVAVVGSTGP